MCKCKTPTMAPSLMGFPEGHYSLLWMSLCQSWAPRVPQQHDWNDTRTDPMVLLLCRGKHGTKGYFSTAFQMEQTFVIDLGRKRKKKAVIIIWKLQLWMDENCKQMCFTSMTKWTKRGMSAEQMQGPAARFTWSHFMLEMCGKGPVFW